MGFPVARLIRDPPAVRETWVQPLGREDPLEEGMAPTPGFLPGESIGQGAWRAAVHGLQRRAHLSEHTQRSVCVNPGLLIRTPFPLWLP